MIPKIIHYCWFGENVIPAQYQEYINGWKTILPDYEFIQWNEKNFDIEEHEFTRDAYKYKNYAFVSDFVRCYALLNFGGFYFDTDVELLKPIDVFLNNQVVLGTEDLGGGILTSFMGCEPNHPLFKRMMNDYNSKKYILEDGTKNNEVINKALLRALVQWGFEDRDICQELSDGINIYSSDFFSTYSLLTGRLNKTENTYAIHWHSLLWVSNKTKIIRFLRLKVLVPILGRTNYVKLRRFIRNFFN